MVTVATARSPLIVASAAMLLKAAPHSVLGGRVREGSGRFAQLGIKLSLFRTLSGGDTA